MSRFPFVKQLDAMQCGVACLKMVCMHYGREVSMERLSQICHVTSEGVSLLGISEAANDMGLHSVCVRTTIDNLSQAPLPCILHWNQNHFVVLYKVRKGKRFYVADPGKGLVSYSRDEFRNHWVSTRSGGEDKGIAMLLER